MHNKLYNSGHVAKLNFVIWYLHWVHDTETDPTFLLLSGMVLNMQRKLLGTISVGFDVTGQQLIIYSAFVKYSRKNGSTMGRCISYL
jgi:hypothetical protein